MRTVLIALLLLSLPMATAAAGSLGPEVTVTAESEDGVATRVNVEAVNANVKTVIQALADLGRFNVVFADGTDGRVTVSLRDVRIDEAAVVVAQSVGLGLEDLGAVKMVGPPEK